MKQLFVVRHCSAAGQSEDAPLTAQGEQQAEHLADFLKHKEIERIVASPYLRAQKSIEPFARQNGISVEVDSRLAERVLSGTLLANWLECLQQSFDDFDLAYAGGESSQAAMSRATAVADEVLSGAVGRTAIVTHGNLMTLLLRHFDARFGFQEWAELTNPDVFLVTTNGRESTVERIWE